MMILFYLYKSPIHIAGKLAWVVRGVEARVASLCELGERTLEDSVRESSYKMVKNS